MPKSIKLPFDLVSRQEPSKIKENMATTVSRPQLVPMATGRSTTIRRAPDNLRLPDKLPTEASFPKIGTHRVEASTASKEA